MGRIKKLKTYKCHHCDARFVKRQSLGGHAVKVHKGLSPNYIAKKINREKRTRERALHCIAKEIHFAMKAGTLDAITGQTFRWIRNRLTAAEREEVLGVRQEVDVNDPDIKARDYRADKGRIRRLKEKIERVLKMPQATKQEMIGAHWLERLENMPTENEPIDEEPPTQESTPMLALKPVFMTINRNTGAIRTN